MELLRDFSILWSFLHTLVVFLVLHEHRLGKRKGLIITLSTMIPLCLLNAFLFVVLGQETMTKLIFVTLTVPSLIFFFCTAKHRDGRFIFTFCAQIVNFSLF